MGKIEMKITFPLDSDGFFRRECPFCNREFKIMIEENEKRDLAQKQIESFMLNSESIAEDREDIKVENERVCPYCEQKAPKTSWWTKEQSEYIKRYIKNCANDLINEHFIKKLERTFAGSKSVTFKGKELPLEEPWISPETDDMEKFELPCCKQAIKIDEKWSGEVHCFFCGFPYDKNKPV